MPASREEGEGEKKQERQRKSGAHNEAAVHAAGFHYLDFDWGSVLLPGPDGLPGEQVVGNRGKKDSFTSTEL